MSEDATWAETLRALYSLSNKGILPGLDRMFAALSDDALALRVVHVAGTNGKGSVCRMIAGGLGDDVGLFTSPHLHRLTERIRVGGVEVDRAEVVARWRALGPEPDLSFFEAVTVIALETFAARGVQLAVLETGLGGRLDSTNVFSAPLVTAVTRVGLDHQAFLGPDLASIAFEKAGILKAGRPAVFAPQHPAAQEVLEARAKALGVPFRWAEGGLPPHHLIGAHQRQNAGVALAVLHELEAQGETVDREAALSVRWPGRLETIDVDGTRWLLDGAHNEDGCRALAGHLEARGDRPTLVFGVMADKAWPAMLTILRPHFRRVVAVAPPVPRGLDPAAIPDVEIAADVPDAIRLVGSDASVVVAGSLLLVGAVRGILLDERVDPPIAM